MRVGHRRAGSFPGPADDRARTLAELPPDELERFEQTARELDITVEPGTRGLDPAMLINYADLAARWGAPFVRVVPAPANPAAEPPRPPECVSRLREVIPHFTLRGVRIALENHDILTSRELASLVEQLGPDRVGICLDTVNSFGALEGPEVVIDRLARFTCSLHLKDFAIERVSHQMGFVIEGCPAGEGRLNIPWLLDQLRARAPGDFNAILENWVPLAETLEATIVREREWRDRGVARVLQWIPA
jgi:sugar phosphate isomerase/epimerase